MPKSSKKLTTLSFSNENIQKVLSLKLPKNIKLVLNNLNGPLAITYSLVSPTIYKSLIKGKKLLQISKRLLEDISKISLVEDFFQNVLSHPHIYSDKIRENKEKNKIHILGTHYYLNLKIGDKLIVTTDLPEFGLYTGMIGCVTKIVTHQKAKILFLFNEDFSKHWTKSELKRLDFCFVKKSILFNNNIKNLIID